MKLKYLLTAVAIVAAAQHSFAQYQQDALRFSTFTAGSTARIKAVGNAGTAIGGDLSSVGGNPAGTGFFTKSEFSLTPEFNGSKVNSTYFGNNVSSTKSTLNFNNASVVIYNRLNTPRGQDKTQGWLSLNVGLSFNRTNNYYEDVSFSGKNNLNSISSYFAEDANSQGTPTATSGLSGNTLGRWGYDAFLIDKYTKGTGVEYRTNVTSTTASPAAQQSNAFRTGGQSEFNISLGSNYSNKFYLGASLGIATLRYNTTRAFTESGTLTLFEGTPATNVSHPFSSTYTQDQVTKGTGVNFKLGAIFKPVDAVRLGFLLTTPTYYKIDDDYSEGLKSNVVNGQTTKFGPVNYPFQYNLTTPLKVAGGLAVFIGKIGFLTGDVEYQDYSEMKLSGDYDATSDNSNIKTLYKSAVNARAGAELKVVPGFFLRGGYGVQTNPEKNNGSDIKTTSGGFGFRQGVYYLDATYSHASSSTMVYPYELSAASAVSPAAALSRSNNNVYITFGLRF